MPAPINLDLAAFAGRLCWPVAVEPVAVEPEPVAVEPGPEPEPAECVVCGTRLRAGYVHAYGDEVYCFRHLPVAECTTCAVPLFERDVYTYRGEAYCESCCPREAARLEEYDGGLLEYHTANPTDLGWFTATTGVSRQAAPKRRYFGVELEYESAEQEPADTAPDLWRAFGRGRCMISGDGSLAYGLELITAPADYTTMHAWLLAFTPPSDCRPRRSCGMHVHVSRDTISPLTLGKILVFVNHPANRELVHTMARRDETEYCKKQEKRVTSHRRGTDGVHDRYQAVNTTNPATIEFRLFASTRTGWKAAAALETVQAIVEFCGQTSVRALSVAEFATWLSKHQSRYKQLVKLLSRDGYSDWFPAPRVKREPITVTL